MRLIDRISLARTISMLLDFIYKVVKLFAPKTNGDIPVVPKKPRKPIFPKIRKKIDEITR